jgi:hypothetical protein
MRCFKVSASVRIFLLSGFTYQRIFLPKGLYYRYKTMSHFPLLQLLDVIDRLPIRYLRESRTRIAPDAVIAQHFPGTIIPAVIDTSQLKEELIGECIYKELWRCSGEYGCTRVATAKATSRSHRCKAQMTVCVYMTGTEEECIACVLEDDPAVHGAEFAAPEAAERNDWRSKAIVANAAAAGARTIGELLSERFWDAQRVPLPQTAAEKTSLRVRLFQLRKKLAKKSKEKESEQSESEEKSRKRMTKRQTTTTRTPPSNACARPTAMPTNARVLSSDFYHHCKQQRPTTLPLFKEMCPFKEREECTTRLCSNKKSEK